MKNQAKQFLRGLAAAVKEGALQSQEARRMVRLLRWSGAIGEPDAVASVKMFRGMGKKMKKPLKTKTPASVAGRAQKLANGARVKAASERLSDTKTYLNDKRTGKPLMWGNHHCHSASERSKAVVGVWWKNLIRKMGCPGIVLTEFEKSLLHETILKGKWVGEVPGHGYWGGGADPSDYVPNTLVKAILDDSISGGIQINPVEFDQNVITYPLLNGQVFPLVDVVPVTRRRITGATIQNPTMTWGQADGTAIQPLNTANLIGPMDTPIYPVNGAVEIGNYLIADSPVDIGSIVTRQYSERLKSELDRVIVSGNGGSEPLGVLNASGLTNVHSDGGVGGPPTVSDYEGMIFSIQKQYREQEWNPAFVANDTSYRRARGIPVGPGDERRVFGMDEESYTLLDYQYRIQNDISNNFVMFGCWRRYRMYQRLGSEVVTTREGRQLTLANTTLIVIRSRFGGQPIDMNGFALMTDAQQ